MYPNKVPTDRDTASQEPLANQADSIYSFIHSFMYVCRSPQKGALLHTYGEKYKVTVHRAPRRRKAHIKWDVASFPKGVVSDTAISNPLPCSLRHTFHLLWVNLSWKNKGPKFFLCRNISFNICT